MPDPFIPDVPRLGAYSIQNILQMESLDQRRDNLASLLLVEVNNLLADNSDV